MTRRYTYVCRVCGTEYQGKWRTEDHRYCFDCGIQRQVLVNKLQAGPEYRARVKQVIIDLLPEEYR